MIDRLAKEAKALAALGFFGSRPEELRRLEEPRSAAVSQVCLTKFVVRAALQEHLKSSTDGGWIFLQLTLGLFFALRGALGHAVTVSLGNHGWWSKQVIGEQIQLGAISMCSSMSISSISI